MRRRSCIVPIVGLLVACGGEPSPADRAPFPADYRATYAEVRDCRQSGDHDLNRIRILAAPEAIAPYRRRDAPFPAGAVVLKEEYDFADDTCTGPIQQWTVMTRLAAGSAPATLDWKWHRVAADREVLEEDAPRCIGCHTGCGRPPEGYEGTCAVP